MVATNVLGVIRLTRALLPGMVARNRGHVVNLGSIAGDYPYPGGHVYGGSKAFVKQFSLNLKADLVGTGVRVTNIEPGLCGGTEFSAVRFGGDTGARRRGLCRHAAADGGGRGRGGGLGGGAAGAREHQPHRDDADLPGAGAAGGEAKRVTRSVTPQAGPAGARTLPHHLGQGVPAERPRPGRHRRGDRRQAAGRGAAGRWRGAAGGAAGAALPERVAGRCCASSRRWTRPARTAPSST